MIALLAWTPLQEVFSSDSTQVAGEGFQRCIWLPAMQNGRESELLDWAAGAGLSLSACSSCAAASQEEGVVEAAEAGLLPHHVPAQL